MKKILPFFLLVLLLASCQKDPDMSKLSDDFVVFTDHNKDANFESFTTFYIPDSVMVIGNSEKPEFWSATEADDIVSTLVSGMEGLSSINPFFQSIFLFRNGKKIWGCPMV